MSRTRHEFAQWVAVGLGRLLRLGIGPDTRLIAIGAPGNMHISRQLFAALQAGRHGVPRLSVATPLPKLVAALDAYQPEVLIGYARRQGGARHRVRVARPRRDARRRGVGRPRGRRRSRASRRAGPAGEPSPAYEPRQPRPAADPLRARRRRDSRGGPDPSGLPFLRIARVDGRSDDILTLPAVGGSTVEVHARRLCAPFSALVDVRQYQIVHGRDGALRIRIIPRSSAPAELPKRVRAAVLRELEEVGVLGTRVSIDVVEGIEREAGQAAKVKLVVSEAPRPT